MMCNRLMWCPTCVCVCSTDDGCQSIGVLIILSWYLHVCWCCVNAQCTMCMLPSWWVFFSWIPVNRHAIDVITTVGTLKLNLVLHSALSWIWHRPPPRLDLSTFEESPVGTSWCKETLTISDIGQLQTNSRERETIEATSVLSMQRATTTTRKR